MNVQSTIDLSSRQQQALRQALIAAYIERVARIIAQRSKSILALSILDNSQNENRTERQTLLTREMT